MEAVTLSINGKTISARAGRTLLQVAKDHGIDIPTLCHAEFLRPIGACRICQVEDLKRDVVVPACVTQITDGMEIQTHSPRVVKNRKNIVRLLMASHPESCLVCEKGNTCELRALAAKLGIGHHGLDPMSYHPMVEDRGPFMARDLSKCIMCAKCLRADQDLVVQGVLDYNLRGFDAHPATIFSLPLENSQCTFCGTCLEVCPTGAIYEKGKPLLSHAPFETESVCSFCSCGCGLSLTHDHIQITSVKTSRKNNGSRPPTLCVRGRFGLDYLKSPQRLLCPLKKTDQGFEPITWDQALELIHENFSQIKEKHGSDALGFIGGAKTTNEESYIFQKLARAVYGTNNLDNASNLHWSCCSKTLLQATGFAAASVCLEDLEKTDLILVIGADVGSSAPLADYAIKRASKNGAKLILINPIKTGLSLFADLELNLKPHDELYFLLAILKKIIEQNLINQEFVQSKTKGFQKLQKSLNEIDLKRLSEKAGFQDSETDQAVKMLGQAPKACLVFGKGVMALENSQDLANTLINLALARGYLGKEGSGLLPLLPDCNSQGALDMGISPELLPGHRPIDDHMTQTKLQKAWQVNLPSNQGLDYASMLSKALQGEIKGLFILRDNPLALFTNSRQVEKALQNTDFLVVQDLFMTQSAELADLVLPIRDLAENQGTTTNLERKVQHIFPAVPCANDFPNALQFMSLLAEKQGQNWPNTTPGEVLKEIEVNVPLYQGLAQQDLAERSAIWPLPGNELVVDTLPHGIGKTDGLAIFQPFKQPNQINNTAEDYPFTLIYDSILPHFGEGTRTNQSPRLAKAEPKCFLGVSIEDFNELELNEKSLLKIISPQGEMELLPRKDERLEKGTVFLPRGFFQKDLNNLFTLDLSKPETAKAPYVTRVLLRKV